MTVQEFLNTTTFEADDIIIVVTQIVHHYTRKECERTYHRVHIA